MLQLMRSRMHRMESLIDGILQYSRAGRDRTNRPRDVDVGALVRDVVDLLAPEHGAIRSPLTCPSSSASGPAPAGVQNLIGNALKHGGRDVQVEITARDAGPCWEFRVSDNGPGIAPEYQERIWGIFQTLAAPRQSRVHGIGLSLVKKIVEARAAAWPSSRRRWPGGDLPLMVAEADGSGEPRERGQDDATSCSSKTTSRRDERAARVRQNQISNPLFVASDGLDALTMLRDGPIPRSAGSCCSI